MTFFPQAAPRFIPVITLYQPYASLFLTDAKPWETRPQACPVKHLGEWVAIHAGAQFAPADWITDTLHLVCEREFGPGYVATLPRSSVIGQVRMGDCLRTELVAPGLAADQLATGIFTPGRWAWGKRDAITYQTPVPARGKQGWGKLQRTMLPEAA